MWPDLPVPTSSVPNNLTRSLNSPTRVHSNATLTSPSTLPVYFSFHLDNPPHPLNAIDASGVLSIAFASISDHDLNQPFIRHGRVRAGSVMLDVDCERREYTWGMFEATLIKVEEELLTRGWWSCWWIVKGGEEGGVVFATGRLLSAIGVVEGDQ